MLGLDGPGLLTLLAWSSPAFPIGAFSYSHGLETAIEEGLIRDASSLADWLGHVLRHGNGWIDAVLVVATHRAVHNREWSRLQDVHELALAWRGSAETALESQQQGGSFRTAIQAVWPEAICAQLANGPIALPVAMAASLAGRCPVDAAVQTYLFAFAANLVSAAVRLIPLGQTDGQRALAALMAIIPDIAASALAADPDRIGSATPMADWCSMRHETQYTRLFRS